MDNARVIYCNLPPTVKGMLVKTFDYEGGEDYYTIVINSRISYEQQKEAYWHEIKHIKENDFDSDLTLSKIEYTRHNIG